MTISYRVMKTHDFENMKSTFYKIGCDCGSDECGLSLEVEWDNDLGIAIVMFYVDLEWASYWTDNIFKQWWLRLKYIVRLLFKGRIQLYDEMTIHGANHIQAVIDVFKECKEKAQKWETDARQATRHDTNYG